MIYSRSTSPFRRTGGRRTWLPLWVVIAIVFFFAFFVYTPLPRHYDNNRDALIQHVANKMPDSFQGKPQYSTLKAAKSKYAYATFLATDNMHPNDPDRNHDNYFVATRMLAYQILHAPETRSNDIPLLVLVTSNVTESKRDRLRKDGAIVIQADPVPKPEWIKIENQPWADVFDKLRLWELTQFDRICFLDGDTVLTKPLDGIFEDPAVAMRPTGANNAETKSEEGPMPPMYVFAGQPELHHQHGYPPTDEHNDYPNVNYLNAGFFVLKPSKDVLNYYLGVMRVAESFKPDLPEQNLLNYAHRHDGNMPWKQLSPKWNIHYPSLADFDGGVVSLHDKFWAPEDKELGPYLNHWRWRMEGFFEARDQMRSA